MEKLLTNYSLTETAKLLVLVALAIRECANLIEWYLDRTKKFVKDSEKNEETEKKIQKERKARKRYEEDSNQRIAKMEKQIQDISDNIDLLIASDKDDIKAFIAHEYNYFVVKRGYIDAFSLDCIERRYEHYVREKGNSYIATLMSEIRKLPKVEPKQQKKEM